MPRKLIWLERPPRLAVSLIESVKDGILNLLEVGRATGTSIARVVRG